MAAVSVSQPSVGGSVPRVVWCGHRGEDALDLVPTACLAGIVCCDWSHELANAERHIPIVSVEQLSGQRKLWSSVSLSDHADAIAKVLGDVARQHEGEIWLVPYMSTPACEVVARQVGCAVKLVAPSATVVNHLSDKVCQRALFAKVGLPIPEAVLRSAGGLVRCTDAGEFPPFPLVVQRTRGSLGLGTHMASSLPDIRDIARFIPESETMLVSRFIDGAAVNIHGVITPGRIALSWPSIMITAAPCSAPDGQKFAYCGNDFGAATSISNTALKDGLALAAGAGRAMADEGMSGLFGVDLLYDGSSWWVLEVNCRFQGSTGLLTSSERRSRQIPLVDEHYRALGGRSLWSHEKRPSHPEVVVGAQVVLYNRVRERVVAREPMDEASEFKGWTLRGAAASGTLVAGGAIMGRLITEGKALEANWKALNQGAISAVERAYHHMGAT